MDVSFTLGAKSNMKILLKLSCILFFFATAMTKTTSSAEKKKDSMWLLIKFRGQF